MSNPDRILERMKSVPADFTVKDLKTILQSKGWEWRQGNHLIARSPNGTKFTIGLKSGRYVKQVNIRMLLKEFES